MKKKITLLLLALVCALCCALGLAACGGGDGGNGDNGGDKFSASEFSSKIETAFQSGYTLQYNLYSSATCEADVANNRYLVTNSGNGSSTKKFMYTKEGADYWQYSADAEGTDYYWAKTPYTQTLFDKIASTRGVSVTISTAMGGEAVSTFLDAALKNEYNSFTYNNAEHSYLAQNVTINEVGSAKKVCVKFKDGKLNTIEVEGFAKAVNPVEIDFSYTKFGETTVTLPDGERIEESKLSETNWQTCLENFASARNFSLQQSVGQNVVGAMKLNGTAYYDMFNGDERIFVKDGENYYRYDRAKAAEDWTKTQITATEYNSEVNQQAVDIVNTVATVFVNNYEAFDYSRNKYTVDTLTINGANGFSLKDVEATVQGGALKKVVCTWVESGKPDRLVTLDNIGTTEIELPKSIPVAGVALDETELKLAAGKSKTLHATVTPENATNKKVTWTTDNSKVATVDENGNVQAGIVGTATITATAENQSAKCTVTVVSPPPATPIGQTFVMKSAELTNPNLTPNASQLNLLNKMRGSQKSNYGKTLILGDNNEAVGGTCDFGLGAFDGLTGDNVFTLTYHSERDYDKVSFRNTVGSSSYMAFSGDYNSDDGTLELTVSTNQASGVTLTFELFEGVIDTVEVTGVTLDKEELTLDIDGTETLTATVAPENATNKKVTWSSSAPAVASVDGTGKVTAKAAGTAIITATAANNMTATCTVKVNAPTLTPAEQLEVSLSQVDNFTVVQLFGSVTMQYDGTSLLTEILTESGTKKELMTKDGENYYYYHFDGTDWTIDTMDIDEYESAVSYAKNFVNLFAGSCFIFDYEDGKYTCATYTAALGGSFVELRDIEIVLENGALKSMEYEIQEMPDDEYYLCEIKDFGTTLTIEIPEL